MGSPGGRASVRVRRGRHEGRRSSLEALAALEDAEFDDDAWETPFVEERCSDVRLRLAQPFPEWYALVNTRAG
jgi:hypothetical protein